MTNNLSVCFIAFAGGIVFGLGPLYSMFFNGLLLGVIGVACQQHGMSVDLWSFVAPHGSLELPSIILAGAAGLRLAHGLLFPGIYSRRESMRKGRRGSDAACCGDHSAAGDRGHARGIFLAVCRAGLAQVRGGRIAVYAAAGVAVPADRGSQAALETLAVNLMLRAFMTASVVFRVGFPLALKER